MNNTFISYENALSIISDHKLDFPIVSKNLEECVGDFLAEPIIADRDFPPFDRVTMDGIAIVYDRFAKGQRSFHIEATVAAGDPQVQLQNNEHCFEIMTGAIMPLGVDTVIRYEDLAIENGIATLQIDAIKHQQNVHFKGSDLTAETVIVPPGNQISSAEINIAASVGKVQLQVRQLPKTIIFSTGDELVSVEETPKMHQIRRSNVYGIQATLKEWGLTPTLHHLPDHKEKMFAEISKELNQYDVFIFTGGVSKGKFDYLPEVLVQLQITKHFHKVQQRPGKPFWFGTQGDTKTIFALPGNPVSSFVCTYVYFKYWFAQSLQITPKKVYAQLTSEVSFKPDLTYFLQAKLEVDNNGNVLAHPLNGNGSGDFASLVHTDGFLILPQEKTVFEKGEVYEVISYRNHI